MTTLPSATGRRGFLAGAAALAMAPCAARASPDTLRVGVSLTDIPHLWGAPEGGFEGLRFFGYTIYDALIGWDLSHADRPSVLVPGLATAWRRDPDDAKRWIVTLRQGVRFHDGSPFDADAAVWNFAAMFDEHAPQYHAPRAALNRARMPSIAGADKIDANTIAVRTTIADAMTPYQLTFLLMASPAQYATLGNWDAFAREPAGTGPFRVGTIVPRTRLDLLRNDGYWDHARIPRVAMVQMIPVPDPSTKVAALRTGQLDLIESVPPDTIDSLKAAGFPVQMNVYPHVWNWSFSCLPGSPFADLRVRQAANLAIDRDGMVTLLNGTALAATTYMIPGSAWSGTPHFALRHDPAAARKLLDEAGYAGKRVSAKILISNSGGGQMQPLEMNEFIKSNLAEAGIDVDFQVVDFITLFTDYRMGAVAPALAGIRAINLASPTQDPTTVLRGFLSSLVAPHGNNWGGFADADVDAALHEAQGAADAAALDRAMAKVDGLLIDKAAGLFVVHDMNPRATAPQVKGLVSPRNWFLDLTSISVR
jgi:ABC-type transport system substrate-binding protein